MQTAGRRRAASPPCCLPRPFNSIHTLGRRNIKERLDKELERNLALRVEPGETADFSAERHLHVLAQHAPDFTVHEIIVDAVRVPGDREREQLQRTATMLDAVVQFADVSRPGTPLHDPAKLAAALEAVRVRGAVPAAPTVPGANPDVNGPRGDDPWR